MSFETEELYYIILQEVVSMDNEVLFEFITKMYSEMQEGLKR